MYIQTKTTISGSSFYGLPQKKKKKTEFALAKAAGPRKIKHQAYTPSEGFKEGISILVVPFLVQLVY